VGSTIQRDDTKRARPSAFDPGEGVSRSRCRSFLFLERGGVRWTAFIVTYQRSDDGYWRGYFAFRCAPGADADLLEVRTADLFVEETEREVDERARGLGRPLVAGLLDSAVDTAERRRGPTPDVQRWFRDMLARRAGERGSADERMVTESTPSLSALRELYESYRLDQVAHWIALLDADDFREFVEIRLDGRRIDFHSRDRLQLAMSVVQDIERRLPLPPFEVWVEDYLAHTEEYRRYARALHHESELP